MQSMLSLFRILLLIMMVSGKEREKDCTVETASGIIVGNCTDYENKPLKVFLGVPYAQPPIDNLRFKKPLPIRPWQGTLLTDGMPPGCMQYMPQNFPFVDSKPGKSEDCLYLNIWVPGNDTVGKKAVMFWIHGGKLTYGSNRLEIFNGQVLAAQNDVIVVTINFRLGLFGFFTSGIKEAPGNMGLYDVLEALKWVNKNIEAFGGNKNKITIFGESSGGLICGFLCISPLAKGLFHHAILQSRSPAEISNDFRSANLDLGEKLAHAVNCSTESQTLRSDPKSVVDCLKKIDAAQLVKTVYSIVSPNETYFNFIYGDDFLPRNPRRDLMSGNFNNVSVFIGYNKDEGSIDLIRLDPELFGTHGEKDPEINKTLGDYLIRKGFKNFPNRDNVVDYYFHNLEDFNYTAVRQQVYHSFGDFKKVCPVIYFGDLISENGNNVYFYYYYHVPSHTEWANWMGVVHFDEVQFCFGRPFDNPSMYSDDERLLSKRIMKLWTDFAKFSRPKKTLKNSTERSHTYVLLTLDKKYPNYLIKHEKNCKFFKQFLKY